MVRVACSQRPLFVSSILPDCCLIPVNFQWSKIPVTGAFGLNLRFHMVPVTPGCPLFVCLPATSSPFCVPEFKPKSFLCVPPHSSTSLQRLFWSSYSSACYLFKFESDIKLLFIAGLPSKATYFYGISPNLSLLAGDRNSVGSSGSMGSSRSAGSGQSSEGPHQSPTAVQDTTKVGFSLQ